MEEMMWFKKVKEKQRLKASPERQFELVQELEHMMQVRDDEPKFLKWLLDNFEDLPERKQWSVILTLYKAFRDKVGQIQAEEMVADRLHLFSSQMRAKVVEEIWGNDYYGYFETGKWKTGRSDRPYNVDEWMDPKVDPKARRPR
jgi:hypothetical protein